MRALLIGVVVLLSGFTAYGVHASRSTPIRVKPSPPLDLAARIEGTTLVVTAASRIGASFDLSAGPHAWRGTLARGEARECRFALEDPTAEITVTARADGITRCVVLNERPHASPGRTTTNSRGEAIVEFAPR